MKTGLKHEAYVCTTRHEDGGETCQFCAGGLFACKHCGAFEGATTTHCPDTPVKQEIWSQVYAGNLDYRWGKWILRPSRFCPAWWTKHTKRTRLVMQWNVKMDDFGRGEVKR